MQITREKMKKALMKALEKQGNDDDLPAPYVGEIYDDNTLLLDGWFHLDSLAEDALEELNK